MPMTDVWCDHDATHASSLAVILETGKPLLKDPAQLLLYKMKVALVCQQLRCGYELNCDRVMGCG
jgi:hypothetical protein